MGEEWGGNTSTRGAFLRAGEHLLGDGRPSPLLIAQRTCLKTAGQKVRVNHECSGVTVKSDTAM